MQEITRQNGTASAIVTDVTEEASIIAMVEKTLALYGRLDAVHANQALTDPAALARDTRVAEMDMALWEDTIAINLRGGAFLAKHCIPPLLETGGGAFVFSGSGRGSQGYLENSVYGISKAGVENLSHYIATQYGKQGIRSNVVAIGLVATEAVKTNLPEQARAMLLEHHLTRELGHPDDIARVVAFLLSDEACFVTGATIAADGRLGCHNPGYADQLRMMGAVRQS